MPSATPAPSATPMPTPTATPSPSPKPPHAKKDKDKDKEWDLSKIPKNLTPEQRKKFLENVQRWKSLPPEQRAELRRSEEFRRKRILKEVNDAIAQSGLKLDEEQRQLFTFKFAQERRTIEENLRQEMEKKRSAAVNDLIQQLVSEFQALPSTLAKPLPPTPTPTPTPAPPPPKEKEKL